MLTLYQAEWCPFSSAVREVLTELGLDFVARQVEPEPEEREELRRIAGTDQIPTLQTEDGQFFSGTRAIFGYLETLGGWNHAKAHRQRFADHRDARESDAPGQLVQYFRAREEPVDPAITPEKTEVVDVPDESRYELRLDGRPIGVAAYHRHDGRIALTHTEVDASCEGRGFGSRLAEAALEDAREQGLEVVPLCPFIEHYIKRHPEYENLVAVRHRH